HRISLAGDREAGGLRHAAGAFVELPAYRLCRARRTGSDAGFRWTASAQGRLARTAGRDDRGPAAARAISGCRLPPRPSLVAMPEHSRAISGAPSGAL